MKLDELNRIRISNGGKPLDLTSPKYSVVFRNDAKACTAYFACGPTEYNAWVHFDDGDIENPSMTEKTWHAIRTTMVGEETKLFVWKRWVRVK